MITNRLKEQADQLFRPTRVMVLLMLVLGVSNANSQVTGVFYEVDTAFYAPLSGSDFDEDGDLAYHVTYSVYAQFTNPTDVLSNIFASTAAGLPTAPMFIDVPCGCYNHPEFGDLLGNVNPFVFNAVPEVQYDTYWTIGDVLTETGPNITALEGEAGVTYNEANLCSSQIADGIILLNPPFISCANLNGLCVAACGADADCLAECANDLLDCQDNLSSEPFAAGDDLTIKIAQVTSACGFSLHACLNVFVEGNQTDPQTWCMDGNGTGILNVSNACEDFLDADAEVSVVDPLDCFGETAGIDVSTAGGAGPFTYNLIDWATGDLLATEIENDLGDLATFVGLGEGEYIVEVVDGNTCRDSTQIFSFVEPTPVLAAWELTMDNECPGVINNAVAVEVSGGVGDYFHTALHTSNPGPGEFPQGDTLYVDIPCFGTDGAWEFTVQDGNGCDVDTIIALNCPGEFEFTNDASDITCYGYNDGLFSGSLTGGTGELILSLENIVTGETDSITFGGGDFEFSDLIPGEYQMFGTDVNGCQVSTQFAIIEPPIVSTDHVTTDVLCAGECTGTIDYVASGGVGGFTFQTTTMNGETADANALCAGTYMAFSTDANGCIFEDQYFITEPDSIIYDVLVSDVTCAGEANGSICIENAAGGTGVLTFEVDPPAGGYQLDPCFDVAVGTYTVNVQDENMCVVSVADLLLIEPEPVQILANVQHVTCTSFADGSVDVSATGGTGDIFLMAPATGELPYLVEGLDAGSLELVVEDANECETSLIVDILEPDSLVVEVLATSDPICGGDCNGVALLDVYGGTGGLTLTANGEEDADFNALCADVYALEVMDINGCSDTAQFVIIEPEPVGVLMNIADVTCTGMNDGAVSIVPVGGTGPVVWSIVEAGLDLANMYEGEYLVQVQDSIGCAADTSFVVGTEEETDMVLFMLSSPVTCWNERDGTATVSVTGGYQPLSFVWSDFDGQTTPTATGLQEDMYSVVVTDSLGCTLTSTVEVEPTIGCLFIAEAITPNADGYNDEWIVGGLEYFPNAVVTVFNRYGQEMFRSVGYRERWDGRFNNKDLPVADYYYVIDFVDGTDPITGTVTLKY